MANICTGCFMYFGKKEALIKALNANFPPLEYYPLESNASRIAHMHKNMMAPNAQLLEQYKGWRVTATKDPQKRQQGEQALQWSIYDSNLLQHIMDDQEYRTDDDAVAFFTEWKKTEIQKRRTALRNQDLSSHLRKSQQTQGEESFKLTPDNIEEHVHEIIVQLNKLMDNPRISYCADGIFRREVNTDILGHRNDVFRANNEWIEFEDEYVLFSHTGDYGWWCPVNGLQGASVQHPDVLFGVAYLEEQGIFGQRLYHNGQELLMHAGPAGTLPDHCTKMVTEYDETYNQIQWKHTMNWQIDIVKKAMTRHVGISVEPLNSTAERE